MRFIGNKESIVEQIDYFIDSKVASNDKLILFDAFCGTGSVSDRLKDKFNVIINDNLKWATIYTAGRLYASICHFERLGLNPFDFLNQSSNKKHGFIYKTYAPTQSNRMYFTPENAARIDYFRNQIEEWCISELVTEPEYMFLLASLIESVSKVSNTAGVYGAFLKKWDGRALKPIEFIKPSFNECAPENITIFNNKIENIISDVKCDILYLDPPYTQNQYGTQYHLLETTAVIYGANAAGKSNVLKALNAMRRIVLDSASRYQRGDGIPVDPFLFDKEVDEPTEFEVTFICGDNKYQYGFATTRERIAEEWLIAYPYGRAQNWFTRAYDKEIKEYKWKFGDKLVGQKQVWREATRNNALFLSTAVGLNSEPLKPVFDWFANKLNIIDDGWRDPFFTALKCLNDQYKKKILRCLKMADMDIEDIEIEMGEFEHSNLPDDMPIELKEQIARDSKGRKILKEANFCYLDHHGKKVALDFDEESEGTKKMFSLMGPWLDSLDNGNILLIDELHNSIHPLMVKFLLEMFYHKDMNKSKAQLIFTTHETSVLKQNIFRREQIWFCEKQERATRLYPLTDFSPRKGVENLEKRYLSGRYGAVPFFQDIESHFLYSKNDKPTCI